VTEDEKLRGHIKQIADTEITQQETDTVVIESQIPKGNKALHVETSVLFIDIRQSTKMTEKIGIVSMTKVYRMFGALSSKAVRDNNGLIIQFIGDGFLAAFNSSKSQNTRENAYYAAKEVKRSIEENYKPVVSGNWHFECGFAITSGHIFMTRFKSKPYKLCSFGIFPGNPTNLASKLCELAKANELYVDESTYKKIKSLDLFIAIDCFGKKVYKCHL
jgi:class 3 adenylate cyclase